MSEKHRAILMLILLFSMLFANMFKERDDVDDEF